MVISEDLRQFIDELNDGHHDDSTGAYIARHFGVELMRLARECEPEDHEENYEDLYEQVTGKNKY
jgi:hypothetical protein